MPFHIIYNNASYAVGPLMPLSKSETKTRESLIVAALLHDAGKIGQRARASLSPRSQERKSLLCPAQEEGRSHSHQHVLWTLDLLDATFGGKLPLAAELAAWHHRHREAELKDYDDGPRLSRCVVLADWLSSGSRRGMPEEDNPSELRAERLLSPFSQLKGDPSSKSYFPLQPLESGPAGLFPVPQSQEHDLGAYQRLYGGLLKDLASLSDDPPKGFDELIRSLLSVLAKHASLVPASAAGMADASLYDHLRLSGALAACLHDAGFAAKTLDRILEGFGASSQPVAFLVKGEASGTSAEEAAELVLQAFDPPLPPCNLLFRGGGEFLILAPPGDKNEKILRKTRDELDEAALAGGVLGALAWTEAGAKEFIRGNFGDVLERLESEAFRAKARRGAGLLVNAAKRQTLLGPVPLLGKDSRPRESPAAHGPEKWGLLRLDVDDLGPQLAQGFEKRSVSTFATASGLLRWFFVERVDSLLQGGFPEVRALRAGADDALFIGPWGEMPKLAPRVSEDFRAFTSSRLTLSAGIFFAPADGFPISRAAAEVGAELEAAQSVPGKNRVSFMGQVLTWRELREAGSLAEDIRAMPRDLPRILFAANSASKDIPRIWRLVYAFARLKERHEARKDGLEALRKRVMTADKGLHPHLGLALRWAEHLSGKER